MNFELENMNFWEFAMNFLFESVGFNMNFKVFSAMKFSIIRHCERCQRQRVAIHTLQAVSLVNAA